MSIYTKILRQDVVLWPKGTNGQGDYGQPLFDAPVGVTARWTAHTEDVIGPDGTTFTSQAKVFLSRDAQPGDVLWLGKLADVPENVVPTAIPLAFTIKAFRKVGNIKQKKFVRLAYL